MSKKKKKSVLFKRGLKMEEKIISSLIGIAGAALVIAGIVSLTKSPEKYGNWLPFMATGALFLFAGWGIAKEKFS